MLVVFFLYQKCYVMVYHHFQTHPCLEHVESLDKIINRNYSKFYVWGSTWTEMSLAQFWWGICQWFTLPRSSPEAGSSYQCGNIAHQKYFLIFCVAVRLPERATLCPCVGRVSCCIGLRGLITPYVHVHGVYFFKVFDMICRKLWTTQSGTTKNLSKFCGILASVGPRVCPRDWMHYLIVCS